MNKRNIPCYYGPNCNKPSCQYNHDFKSNNDQPKKEQPKKEHYKEKEKEKFNGYLGKLQYIKTIEYHKKDIENILYFKDSNYIASDCEKFYLYDESDESIVESRKVKNIKIGKLIISSDKSYIIFYEMDEEKGIYMIKVFTDPNKEPISCKTSNKPINIFEINNFIIVIESDWIELFYFQKDQLNIIGVNIINLNEIQDFQIKKPGQITSIDGGGEFIFCGHQNGLVSVWSIDYEKNSLLNIKNFRLHYDSINKILCDTIEKDKVRLITCSSDKTLKVHNFENYGDRICTDVIHCEAEVIDVKTVKNFEKKIIYIVSIKNGVLKVFNSEFKEIFDIPSRFKTSITRLVLGLKNNEDEKGDYLLITEGQKIDKFCWIKEKEKINLKNIGDKK